MAGGVPMKKKEWVCAILCVLCLIYSYVIYQVRAGTSFFMIWVAGAVFFAVLIPFFHFGIWRRIPKMLRRIIAVVLVVGIVSFSFVEACVISGFFVQEEAGLDYIVVLGAQVRKSGPSVVLRYRLDRAVDYLMENENTICIVSGGQGANEPVSEAQGMYTYLLEKGIPEDRILMEDESVNTVQNLTNSKAFLNPENDRVGIVTSNFHIFRSTRIAKRQGYAHVCGIVAGSNPNYLLNNMVREFFGVVKDLLCGNM